MTRNEIVTYEVAKLAKEKGFNERTRYFYETNCVNPKAIEHCSGSDYFNKYPKAVSAPTQSLLQRWLREEKGIIVIPYYRSVLRMWSATYELTSPYTFEDLRKCFNTYELALEDALKYALKYLV